MTSAKQRIVELGQSLGFNRLVIASPEPLSQGSLDFYEGWLERGYSAGMDYLQRDPRRRTEPLQTFPQARSIVVASVSYFTEVPEPPADIVWGRVAGYAVGLDYHNVLRARLRQLSDLIDKELGRTVLRRAVTDDAALYEQALAERHGLGFVGKNTLVIGPKLSGTYNLIGELFLDLELEPDEPYRGTCGNCFRCGTACPTEAIVPAGIDLTAGANLSAVPNLSAGANLSPNNNRNKAFVVDANRCISYLTIENKGGIDLALREKLGDWVFGCDICQEVCPYNSKPPLTPWPEFHPERGAGHYLDLLGILNTSSQDEFRARFIDSPVRRPKLRGLQRNSLVVLGNKLRRLESLNGKVPGDSREQAASNDPERIIGGVLDFLEVSQDEMLVEHARWAINPEAVGVAVALTDAPAKAITRINKAFATE